MAMRWNVKAQTNHLHLLPPPAKAILQCRSSLSSPSRPNSESGRNTAPRQPPKRSSSKPRKKASEGEKELGREKIHMTHSKNQHPRIYNYISSHDDPCAPKT